MLFAALGLAGCDLCINDCVDDAGAEGSDDGQGGTTGSGLGWTSTSGGTWPSTSVGSEVTTNWSDTGIGATTCGGEPWGETDTSWSGGTEPWGGTDTSWSGETEETEGLGCGGSVPPPDVVDMKIVRAGDMVPPPAAYSADTRFLVLRSQGNVCGPDPLAPPDCDDPEEFTLVVVIPPESQTVDVYDFGDYESETGFGEADLESWIHIGGTASCQTGVIPNSALLFIDTIAADGAITGQICNFYWMPGLGQGLSGYVDAASC